MELFLIVILLLIGAGCLFASLYYTASEMASHSKTKKLKTEVERYIQLEVRGYLRDIEDDERVIHYLVAGLVGYARTLKKTKTYQQQIDRAILDDCIRLLENETLQQAIKRQVAPLKRAGS